MSTIWCEECQTYNCADAMGKHAEQLVIENSILREALEEIADGNGCNCRVGPGCDWKCKDIARAAIKKAKGEA